MRRRALCGDSPAGCRRSPHVLGVRLTRTSMLQRVYGTLPCLALWANAPAPAMSSRVIPGADPYRSPARQRAAAWPACLLPAPALILRAADGPAHNTERPSLPCVVPSQICEYSPLGPCRVPGRRVPRRARCSHSLGFFALPSPVPLGGSSGAWCLFRHLYKSPSLQRCKKCSTGTRWARADGCARHTSCLGVVLQAPLAI